MNRKTAIGLFLVIGLLPTAHILALWQGLHRKPDPQGSMKAVASNVTASQFRPTRRTRYPHLFDVQIPPSTHDNGKQIKKKKAGGIAKPTAKKISETPEGMRLKAIFISRDQRVALVEPRKKKSEPFLEVREADTVLGYRVQRVAAGYISLLREEDQEVLKLVIFDSDRDTSPGSKP